MPNARIARMRPLVIVSMRSAFELVVRALAVGVRPARRSCAAARTCADRSRPRASRAPTGSPGVAGFVRRLRTSSLATLARTKDTKDKGHRSRDVRFLCLCSLILASIFFRIASSIPLMNFTDSSVRERPRQLERLVDHDRRRRPRIAEQLAGGHPQDQPVEHRHALGPPPLRRVGNQRIDFVDAAGRCRCASDEANARSSASGGSALRPLQREERVGGARHVGAADSQ